MYRQVETDASFECRLNGTVLHPIATLADEWGGRTQIVVDDGCYVVYNKYADLHSGYGVVPHTVRQVYQATRYLFPEVLDVLRILPNPAELRTQK